MKFENVILVEILNRARKSIFDQSDKNAKHEADSQFSQSPEFNVWEARIEKGSKTETKLAWSKGFYGMPPRVH